MSNSLKTSVEQYVVHLISEEIQLPEAQLKKDKLFVHYGIDSITIINLNRKLEQKFGDISKTLFYQCKNIDELVSYFMENYSEYFIEEEQGKQPVEQKKEESLTKEPEEAENEAAEPESVEPETVKTEEVKAEEKSEPLQEEQAKNPIGIGAFIKTGTILEETKKPIRKAESRTFVGDAFALADGNMQDLYSQNYRDEDVAIIGISGRYPMADNLDELWDNLKDGKDCISVIPKTRWNYKDYHADDKNALGQSYLKYGGFLNDVDKFDPTFFGIAPNEAKIMDPQDRLFLQTAWSTVEDAGYSMKRISGQKVGVFVGVMWGQYQLLKGKLKDATLHGITSYASIPNRVSYIMDLKGPSVAVDTMCSSSLTSVHYACKSLKNGECTMALAGGVNVTIHPNKYITLSAQKFASADGHCRSFGDGGDGYVPGEGVGAVLLKPVKRAIKDKDHIYAVIKATALNHNGMSNGFSVPSPNAQADVEQDALAKSGVNVSNINYIEAHGTGTSLGDPIEITGLSKAYDMGKEETKRQYCAIGSIKSNIGHLEGAAGIAAITKVVLQLKNKKLVPSILSDTLNQNITFENTPFHVQHEFEDWPAVTKEVNGETVELPRTAGISSFGAGGSNAHVILQEYEGKTESHKAAHEGRCFVLSAKNEERLKEYVARILNYVNDLSVDSMEDDVLFERFAYTYQIGRTEMEERLAFVAFSFADVKKNLQDYLDGIKNMHIKSGNSERRNDSLDMILQDVVNDEYINQLIRDNKLERICELWITGVEINWNMLYGGKSVEILSVPGYPFAQESYWVCELGKIEDDSQGTKAEPLTTLIDSNCSSFAEQCYEKTFTGKEEYLANHKINGQMVLPGAVYVEMARQAVMLALPGIMDFTFSNIQFVKQLFVKKDPVKVYIQLIPEEDTLSFVIEERQNDSKIVHAKGTVAFEETKRQEDVLDINRIKEETKLLYDESTDENMYDKTAADLEYGPYFRGIRKLYGSEKEALSLVERQNEGDDKFVIVPAILDNAFQSTSGILENDKEGKIFLPYAIEQLSYYGTLPDKCYVKVERIEDSQEENAKVLSVSVYDISLRLALKIERFILKEAYAKALNRQLLENCYYAKHWVVKELEENEKQIPSIERLLLIGGKQYAPVIAGYCKNTEMIVVEEGEQFCKNKNGSFEVKAGSEEDFLKLINQLKENNQIPDKVVFMIEEADMTGNPDVDFYMAYNVFFCAKALISLSSAKKINFLVAYKEKKEKNGLARAFGAFAQVLAKENPMFRLKAVSYQNDEYLRELSGGLEDTDVQYVDGKRYVTSIHEVSPKTETDLFRMNGVYLITGGLGGLGLIFANHLAKEYHAKLILTGRSKQSEKQSEKIAELEKQGAVVQYYSADVSDINSLRQVITQGKQAFGSINGVVHCAGVLRDSFLLKKTKQQMTEVFEPKLYGARNLDLCLQEEKLDFFCLCSSIAALSANIGQSDYAYANCAMDVFAENREQLRKDGQRYGKTISVNWPIWASGGMTITDAITKEIKATMGMVPLETENGVKAFHEVCGFEESSVIVLQGDKKQMDKVLLSSADKKNSKANMAETKQERKSKVQVSEGEKDLQYKAVLSYVEELVEDETGYAKVKMKDDDSLDMFGLDSVMIMNMNAELETKFPDISKTIFYECKTLKDVADTLMADYPDIISMEFAIEDSAKEVENDAFSDVHSENKEKLDDQKQNEKAKLPFQAFFNTKKEQRKVPEKFAIVGISGRYPKAEDLNQFWENLKNGVDAVTEVPRDRWNAEKLHQMQEKIGKWGSFLDDVDKFDPLFFNITPREAEMLDPQERIFLEVAYETFEDAGYTRKRLRNNQVGVYVGVMWSQYQIIGAEETMKGHVLATGGNISSIANRVSYYMDLTGPSMAVDSMCSSSLTAIHLACESIRSGECDMALAGGVNLMLHPSKYILLAQGNFTSSDGRCRSFGEGGDGYVPGEGAGAVLIKSLDKAIEDHDQIYGVILGTSINHGGKTSGFTVPNQAAQKDLIATTLQKANVDPQSISYVEAHGTGTALGDPIEINALQRAFEGYTKEKQYCSIGSVKSNIGHLESAAGIAGITKVLLQMKHKQLVPSIHSKVLNSNIDFKKTAFYVQQQVEDWNGRDDGHHHKVRRAAVSAFGAGGSNAHIILEEYKGKQIETAEQYKEQLIPVSAKTQKALKQYARRLYQYFTVSQETKVEVNKCAFNVEEAIEEVLGVSRDQLSMDDTLISYGVDEVKFDQILSKAGLSGIELTDHLTLEELLDFVPKQEMISEPEEIIWNLSDIAYTMQSGREEMEERFAILASDMDGFLQGLKDYLDGKKNPNVIEKTLNHDMLQEFMDNDIGREFTKYSLQNADIRTAAKLWTNGMSVDLSQFENKDGRRITLPTYPFEKTRCWIEIVKEPVKVFETKSTSKASYFISNSKMHKNDIVFETESKNEKLGFTTVAGNSMLPLATAIEMMREAGELLSGQSVLALKKVTYEQPLLKANCFDTIKTIGNCINGQYTLRITSGTDILNATSELGFAKEDAEIRREWEKEFHKDRKTLVSKSSSELYADMSKQNVEVGTAKYLHQYVETEDGILVESICSSESQNAQENMICAHMESALQALCYYENKKAPAHPYMPASIEEIVFEGAVLKKAFIWIRKIEGNWNVGIFNESGKLEILLRNVLLIETELAENTQENDIYAVYNKQWNNEALATKNMPDGKVIVLYSKKSEQLAEEIRKRSQFEAVTLVSIDQVESQSVSFDSFVGMLDLTAYYEGDNEEDSNCYKVIEYLQKYLKAAGQKEIFLFQFTYLLQAYANDDIHLLGAKTTGLYKMLGAEYKKVNAKTIDSDCLWDANMLLDVVAKECAIKGKESEICYRDGERYVPSLKLSELEHGFCTIEKKYNPEKAVILTGGTGGIGFAIARALVQKGFKKIALTGYQVIPEETQWNTILESGEQSKVQDKIKQIKELKDMGASVLYWSGSLNREKELSEFFQEVSQKLGPVGGVMHCAGRANGNTPAFVNKNMESIKAVYEPKIEGLQTLHKVMESYPIDFCVLFSSVSGAIPALAVGLSDYASANGYMNHFTEYQRQKGYSYYQCLNWTNWDAGMGGTVGELYLQNGFTLMSKEQGVEALEMCMEKDMASGGIVGRVHVAKNADAMLHTEKPKTEQVNKPRVETVRVQTEDTSLIKQVKGVLAKELHMDESLLIEDKDFSSYGVDSILIASLVEQLEMKFHITVEPSALLENPTIGTLSRYIEERLKEQKNDKVNTTYEAPHKETKSKVEETLVFKWPVGHEKKFQKEQITTDETIKNLTPTGIVVPEAANRKIAVVGMACHFPKAANKEQFWRNLCDGVDGIVEVPKDRWDVSKYYSDKEEPGKSISKWGGFLDDIYQFDSKKFGFPEEVGSTFDPLIKLMLTVAGDTILDAGYDKDAIGGKRVGVFVGTRSGGYSETLGLPKKETLLSFAQNFIASHVSHCFDLKGPSCVVDTACSSSLTSIHLACQSIISNDCEMALAGGVDVLLNEKSFVTLSSAKALSPDGKCHTFDEKANGFVPGEGCGAVLLKDYEAAKRDGERIYAVIESSAINNDGRTMGVTTPNPLAQEDVIRRALERGNLNARDIGYIEAHGTGTMIGDPIELKALTKIFRKDTQDTGFCGIGSVKTNIGHLLSAAGVSSFIKTALAIYYGKIPMTLNCDEPNKRFEFEKSPFYICQKTTDWTGKRYAGISSFGFGGTNAHIILGEAGESVVVEENTPKQQEDGGIQSFWTFSE